jgi:hypothetical protein
MRRSTRQQRQFVQKLIACLSLALVEFNVLCNPFSPIQILRWVQSSNLERSTANSLADTVAETSSEWSVDAGKTNLPGAQPDRAKPPPRLELPPEIDDVVAIRPRLRMVGFRLPTIDYSLPAPVPEFLSNFAESDESQVAHRISIQKQLGRLRC